jgi:LysR family glycine cleavage system transcriptional activator
MRRRLPSLNQLRAFEAAARPQSFSKAADELFVTHAAVSRHVRELEEWLGTKLFVRTGRGVVLSDAGKRYAARLTPIFDAIAEATRDAMIEGDSSHLTVAPDGAFASRWLIPRLGSFNAAHPEIELSVSPGEYISDFYKGEDDIAIRYGTGGWPEVEAELLCTARIFPVCAPHVIADDPPQSPDDLARFTLLHENSRQWWADWLRAAGCKNADLAWHGPLFQNYLAIQAAEAGQGFALADQLNATDALAAGRLARPFDFIQQEQEGYWLVWGKGLKLNAAGLAFRQWLVKEIRKTQNQFDKLSKTVKPAQS